MDEAHASTGLPSRARRTRLLSALLAVVAILPLAAAPAFAADPAPRTARPPVQTGVKIQSTTRTVSVDLSRSGAAVTQFTSYWCVPAATQTMLNLVRGTSDRTYRTQSRLYDQLRAANLYTYATKGNDVRGWARVLTAHLGPSKAYADMSFTSRGTAYETIVRTMERTGRPVGIVVDAGSHAWTVVGYRYEETPGVAGSREILGFTVIGPLGSPSDPWPKKYYTVTQLNSRFTRYHEWQRAVVWEDKYVIVAPVIHDGGVTVDR